MILFSKKSSPQTTTSSVPLCRRLRGYFVVAALLVAGCHAGNDSDGALSDDRGCALADSLLRQSGLGGELDVSGRATIDINQYRVRGRFSLSATQTNNIVLEFTSTSPMGGRREDVVVSLYEDTLRIFDRERAKLHEGTDVEDMVEAETDLPIDLARLIPLVLARMPDCARLSAMNVSSSLEDFSGEIDGERFDFAFSEGRLVRARWPLPLREDGPEERLEIEYEWGDGALERITALLPERSWRIKLRSD